MSLTYDRQALLDTGAARTVNAQNITEVRPKLSNQSGCLAMEVSMVDLKRDLHRL